jgi:hypothetical protein
MSVSIATNRLVSNAGVDLEYIPSLFFECSVSLLTFLEKKDKKERKRLGHRLPTRMSLRS